MRSSIDDEKAAGFGHAAHIDGVSADSNSDVSSDEIYTLREQKKIIHRVDRRLVTMCGFMYCISLMDRTNLGAAAIAGYGDLLTELDACGCADSAI